MALFARIEKGIRKMLVNILYFANSMGIRKRSNNTKRSSTSFKQVLLYFVLPSLPMANAEKIIGYNCQMVSI